MFVRIYGGSGQSLACSFEDFIQGIQGWDGMYAELDGSWVWVFHREGERFQLDGMVYDQAGAIEYVEIKGNATREAWERICKLLVADSQPTRADVLEQHLRVHDIEQQCWRSPSDPVLFDR